MKSPLRLLVLLAAGLAGQHTRAQSVGIGTTMPDAKSALDIRATDKGLLIPRLTAAQRTGIVSPPQGLMVYQTDGSASGGPQTVFWYYAGTGGWVYLDAAGGSGLTLPYSGTASTSSPAFAVSNTGTGQALSGSVGGNGAAAVRGENTSLTSGSGTGVLGATVSGYGVRGTASGTNGYGVAGEATDGRGVSGIATSGAGLYGRSTSGPSVQAQKTGSDQGRAAEITNLNATNDSTTAYISTTGDRPALRAVNSAASAQAALRGVKTAGTDGSGVEGVVTSGGGNAAGVLGTDRSGTSVGSGVIGLTTSGYGVRGIASANGGYGVSGVATDSYGVTGTSGSGVGTYGISTSNSGIQGYSTSSYGVQGTTAAGATGNAAGVFGSSTNSNGGVGVLGTTTSSAAVRGVASGSSGRGLDGSASGNSGRALNGFASGAADGLVVQTSGTGQAGYFGQTNSSNANTALEVQNASAGRTAFFNQTNANSTADAVSIFNAGTGATLALSSSNGIAGAANYAGSISFGTPTAQYGEIRSFAASFAGPSMSLSTLNASSQLTTRLLMNNLNNTLYGNSQVQGNLGVSGTLSKGGGSFKIDHPLDPENQYLYHSFVESPDMLNVYNGNVTLDAQGEATVTLPDYFEALNRDFRYQLTPIGAAFTPYVLAEVAGNRFRIAGQPGGRVSWQVTGIRHDKWADQNRIPVAAPKEAENQGKYLHPQAYGQPLTRGIGYRPEPGTAAAARH